MPRRKATDPNLNGGRRREIILAATKLFGRHGFHGTSIDEIAREVGLPKGSIYNYVRSKEEILYEVVIQGFKATLPEMRVIADSDGNAEAKLRQLVYKNSLAVMKYRDSLAIFFSDGNNLSSENYKEHVRCREEMKAIFTKVIDQGIAEGTFATDNVDFSVSAIYGMCTFAIIHLIRVRSEISPEKIATFFSQNAIKMVRP